MSFPLLRRPQLPAHTCRSCLLRISQAPQRSKATKSKVPRPLLPTSPARTRFAPSPTGYLHLGSLRTALFNYLLAKRTGGQFLLRIEDTDQKRTVWDAEERLFRDLQWAGLQWDEGPGVGGPYGPYKQSERSEMYQEHARKLLDTGHGYRCFCSTTRLNELAQHRHALGVATDYDRRCGGIPKEESDDRASRGEHHVVRLKVDSYPKYEDLIYGTFTPLKQWRRGEDVYEDPILLKSDGLPTYHLANVVDDHYMKITHVIRGSEWMPSTPKHIALYDAFGWTPPAFAHVGLLVDEQGNKLSKRNFDTDISAFKEMEIFPETLTNFAALLGWSHPNKSDVMDLAKLVEEFTLKFTKGNTTVTFEKMHFLQRKHALARAKDGGPKLQEMVQAVVRVLKDPISQYELPAKFDKKHALEKYVEKVILADSENYTNANEYVYRNAYMFKLIPSKPLPSDATGLSKQAADRLSEVHDWNKEALTKKIWEIIQGDEANKSADVFHYLREKLTGEKNGMRIYELMILLGRDECLRRLGVEM
ncbi:glutamyl-tRNA synthetase-like protein [Amniculicola lignicola CBS 123094]|uniref:Glutamate--tRNA ligase, mitochondrial n=1 Tax=Amniculicola lignicola CBS 123094 TaxID=1392246 RepID=A0A6A5WTM5_9PLEO|nr:glutamyl-tRNA synthetase-like protein [Amniculicola lignicola CBS 123094]